MNLVIISACLEAPSVLKVSLDGMANPPALSLARFAVVRSFPSLFYALLPPLQQWGGGTFCQLCQLDSRNVLAVQHKPKCRTDATSRIYPFLRLAL